MQMFYVVFCYVKCSVKHFVTATAVVKAPAYINNDVLYTFAFWDVQRGNVKMETQKPSSARRGRGGS